MKFVLSLFVFAHTGAALAAPVFRLSIQEPPKLVDPYQQRSSSGVYIPQQLYRNFYRLDGKGTIIPDLGERCLTKKNPWRCEIKKTARWSDGTPITADDFRLSWLRALELPSPRASLLFAVKGAEFIYEKTAKSKDYGIQVIDSSTFEIHWRDFSKVDPTFLLTPLLPVLQKGVWRKEGPFSGPYQVQKISPTTLQLTPNPHYHKKSFRPDVHFLLMDENLVLSSFEAKKIDFVRRVPTSQIPTWRDSKSFFQVETLRMDSLFFGPELAADESLRKNLISALNYEELKKLFNSNSLPGCVGVPRSYYSGEEICVPSPSLSKAKPDEKKELEFYFSSSGGEDHRRLSEWLQTQWSPFIQLRVRGLENKIFLSRLQKQRPAIYRRGVSPEFPSCSNLLRFFRRDSADNLSQISSSEFDKTWEELLRVETPLEGPNPTSKSLCRKALELLMTSAQMIPTGRIEMSFLVSSQWKGLEINSLNHLDLSGLEPAPK